MEDNFDLRKFLKEQRISENKELTDLVDEFRSSTDPDNDNGYDSDYREPEEIISDIRSKFGDKIADQVESGKGEMHYGREYSDGGDDLASKQRSLGYSPNLTTKSGKMHKGSISKMKNYYKRGY